MRFNLKKKGQTVTNNHEGALAYTLSSKLELYTATVSTLLQKSFYESGDERLKRIIELVEQIANKDPGFVAKLAVYAREKMYLRTVPVVLLVELAKVHNGDSLVRKALSRVIKRPDEITELLAYYQITNKRSGAKKLGRLSKQLQKGVAEAFNRFDEYQFAKYNRAAEVSLRDALFLVHPKAKDAKQQEIFDKIISGSLSVPYTWETELSKAGQEKFASQKAKEAAFRQKWEELILSEKLAYMALLRNLRNLLDYGVSREAVEKAARYLASPSAVKKSKQLPFRYYSAYKELRDHKSGYSAYFLDALEGAMLASVENLKGFELDTRILIAADMSGSMDQAISGKSKIRLMEVGLVLASLLKSKCKHVITGLFGETYETVALGNKGILANVEAMKRVKVGHSTNGYLAIRELFKRRIIVDKVFVFTDCQLWNSNYGSNETIEMYWNKYKRIAPDAKIYIFDLAGYGQAPLKSIRKDVFLIGGWSEKIFDILSSLEGREKVLAQIEDIEV
ncbi:MAG: TROVE domain-containing protein [Bacteroidia bacterium]|nr:TROVE domain-containing protein [Bacteroidia bacterium]